MAKLTPQQLAEQINEISDESYQLHQELAGINSRMDISWLGLRGECKTDGECTRKLNASTDGQRAMFLKYYLKGLSHKRTALILEAKNNAGHAW